MIDKHIIINITNSPGLQAGKNKGRPQIGVLE
jgi:hypothetical protein